MKKMVILFLSIIALYSCDTEKKGIVLLDDDTMYLPLAKVDSLPSYNDTEVLAKKIKKIFLDSRILPENFTQTILINYYYYVGEDGLIKNMKRQTDGAGFGMNLPKNFQTNIEPKILEVLEEVVFIPAMKGNQKVKFKSLFMASLFKNKSNEIECSVFLGLPKEVRNNLFDGLTVNPSEFFISVEESPMPIGGIEVIQKNISYPESAKKSGIEGRVFVKTFIDEAGRVVKTEIIKSVHNDLDSAAAAAIEKTKFFPGKMKGTPVKTQVVVPIVFKLQ